MSAMLEALRAQYEPHLVCPKCGCVNIPACPPYVHIEMTTYVTCDQCGKTGPLNIFQPKKEPRP